MKIRTDFVTNSSSSGFVAIKVSSNTLDRLLKKTGLDESIFTSIEENIDGDYGVPEEIEPDVALTLSSLLIREGLPFPEAYGDLPLTLSDCLPENCAGISSFVDNALKEIADAELDEKDEDAELFKSILNLVKLICENSDVINTEASAEIASGSAQSDSGGPNFSYACLNVKDGNGEYAGYSVYDGYYGDDTDPSALYKWAKENGYYDIKNESPEFMGGYDESFYFNPPYEKLLESYQDVTRIKIVNGEKL